MNKGSLLWWVIPEILAGMPVPYLDPQRRMNRGGALDACPDELPDLYSAGIRAVVSLLNNPSDAAIYESARFAFLCLPIPDGHAPTMEQATKFMQFMIAQRSNQRAVAVHCEAGIGRTGTMIASYLITLGDDVKTAIARVRAVEPRAIETARQVEFLEYFARHGLKTIRFEDELLPKWGQFLHVAAVFCSASEETQRWFSRFTNAPGVEDSRIIILQCESLQAAIRQRKDWLAFQLKRSQDPQRVPQIIAALEYSLDTMIQQARAKKTCSWTLDDFEKPGPSRGDFGDSGGDITLRRV
jgi:atypical dual specificity phosphatase